MKPRDRSLLKKQKREINHAIKLSESYIPEYESATKEISDYYKQQSINLYITEQFCQGDKFLKLKNEKLLAVSMAK